MKKIIRTATISLSLNVFCKGLLRELRDEGFEVLAASSPDKGLCEVGEREGVRTVGVPMERHIYLSKDLVSLVRLVRLFIKEKPDIVHSMTPKAGLLCMMAAWLTRVPVRVHTFTGLVWPTSKGLQRKVLMATDWLTCACATHVIPEGQGVKEDLQKHITKKPMRVLGYGNVRGIDLLYWKKTTELEQKSEKLKGAYDGGKVFTFLFVGRIVGDKGFNELIDAMDSLANKTKQITNKFRLVLVGRFEDELDPVKPETRQMIEKMPEIESVGPQFGEELLAWYAAADCFVFPSYREGFPNTVIEAGAMELPCIVTDINGSREIIANADYRNNNTNIRLQPGERMSVRENGVVIPSQDTKALRDAMLWMMEHPEERKKMGQRAREMVADRYEQSFVRQCLYDFYREVLG